MKQSSRALSTELRSHANGAAGIRTRDLEISVVPRAFVASFIRVEGDKIDESSSVARAQVRSWVVHVLSPVFATNDRESRQGSSRLVHFGDVVPTAFGPFNSRQQAARGRQKTL